MKAKKKLSKDTLIIYSDILLSTNLLKKMITTKKRNLQLPLILIGGNIGSLDLIKF